MWLTYRYMDGGVRVTVRVRVLDYSGHLKKAFLPCAMFALIYVCVLGFDVTWDGYSWHAINSISMHSTHNSSVTLALPEASPMLPFWKLTILLL